MVWDVSMKRTAPPSVVAVVNAGGDLDALPPSLAVKGVEAFLGPSDVGREVFCVGYVEVPEVEGGGGAGLAGTSCYATGGNDGTLRLWSISNNVLLSEVPAHDSAVTCVALFRTASSVIMVSGKQVWGWSGGWHMLGQFVCQVWLWVWVFHW